MPRLKLDNKNKELRGVIAQKKAFYGITTDDIAKRLGVTQQAVSYKLNKPRAINLEDLRVLKEMMHLSAEEIYKFL